MHFFALTAYGDLKMRIPQQLVVTSTPTVQILVPNTILQ